jgi:hypothetical protein
VNAALARVRALYGATGWQEASTLALGLSHAYQRGDWVGLRQGALDLGVKIAGISELRGGEYTDDIVQSCETLCRFLHRQAADAEGAGDSLQWLPVAEIHDRLHVLTTNLAFLSRLACERAEREPEVK